MPLGPNPAHRARPNLVEHEDWQLRVAAGVANDNLTPRLVPSSVQAVWADDDRFTHDTFASAAWSQGQKRLELSATLRYWTMPGGMERTDIIDTAASMGQTYRFGSFALSGTGIVGVTSTGDYAGSAVQDRWHGFSGMGRRLGSTKGNSYHRTPLQDRYDPGHRFGLTLGGDTSLSLDLLGDHLRAEAGVEGQLAVGKTGLSYVRPHAGVDAHYGVGPIDAFVAQRFEATRAVTRDPTLQQRGGYELRRWFATPESRVGVRVGQLEGGMLVRLNEGGTGFHTSAVYIAGGLP